MAVDDVAYFRKALNLGFSLRSLLALAQKYKWEHDTVLAAVTSFVDRDEASLWLKDHGATYQEIGDLFGLSRERICQRIGRGIAGRGGHGAQQVSDQEANDRLEEILLRAASDKQMWWKGNHGIRVPLVKQKLQDTPGISPDQASSIVSHESNALHIRKVAIMLRAFCGVKRDGYRRWILDRRLDGLTQTEMLVLINRKAASPVSLMALSRFCNDCGVPFPETNAVRTFVNMRNFAS